MEGEAKRRVRAAKAAKFVQLVMRGYSYTDAYVKLYPESADREQKSLHEAACRFAKNPQVTARMMEATEKASVQALDSHARFHTDLLADMESMRRRNADTALAALYRVRGASGAFIQDKISIEDRSTTRGILERLAKLDPRLADAAKATLEAADSFTAGELTSTEQATKH